MISHSVLDEYQESILNYIKEEPLRNPVVAGAYQSLYRLKTTFGDTNELADALQQLSTTGHIEYFATNLRDGTYLEAYKLTPRGSNYLRNSTSVTTTIRDVHGSNIAVGSADTAQSQHVNSVTPRTYPNDHKWFWWLMSIIGGVIILLIAAYVFGIGK